MKRNKILFEPQMESFFKELRSFDVEKEDITGVIKEYVTIPKLYAIYQNHFKTDALRLTSIQYRVKTLIKDRSFPEDLLYLDKEQGVYKNKIFINRLNNRLIRKIFLPNGESLPQGIKHNLISLDDLFRSGSYDDADDDD